MARWSGFPRPPLLVGREHNLPPPRQVAFALGAEGAVNFRTQRPQTRTLIGAPWRTRRSSQEAEPLPLVDSPRCQLAEQLSRAIAMETVVRVAPESQRSDCEGFGIDAELTEVLPPAGG